MDEKILELKSIFLEASDSLRQDVQNLVGLHSGNHSAYQLFYSKFQQSMKEALQSLTNNYTECDRKRIQAETDVENLNRLFSVQKDAFTYLSTYSEEIQKISYQIWVMFSQLAKFVVDSDNELRKAHSMIQKLVRENCQLKKVNEENIKRLEYANSVIEMEKEAIVEAAQQRQFYSQIEQSIKELKAAAEEKQRDTVQQLEEKCQRQELLLGEKDQEIEKLNSDHQEEIEKLQTTISKLESDIEEKDQQIQVFNQMMEGTKEYEEKISQLEQNNSQLNQAITTFCSEFPYLSFDGTKIDYQCTLDQSSVLESSLSQARQNYQNALTENNNLRTKFNSIEQTYKIKIEDLEAINRNAQSSKEEAISRIEAERDAERSKNAELTSQLHALEYNIRHSERKSEDLRKQLQEATLKNSTLLETQSRLTDEYLNQIKILTKSQTTEPPIVFVKPSGNDSEAIHNTNEALRREKIELEQVLKEKETEIEALKLQITNNESAIPDLQKKLDESEESHSMLKKKYNQLVNKFKENQKTYESQNSSLLKEKEELQEKISELEKQNQTAIENPNDELPPEIPDRDPPELIEEQVEEEGKAEEPLVPAIEQVEEAPAEE